MRTSEEHKQAAADLKAECMILQKRLDQTKARLERVRMKLYMARVHKIFAKVSEDING